MGCVAGETQTLFCILFLSGFLFYLFGVALFERPCCVSPPVRGRGGREQVQVAMVLEDASGLELEDRILQLGTASDFRAGGGGRWTTRLPAPPCCGPGHLWGGLTVRRWGRY